MIKTTIQYAIRYRLLVLLACLVLAGWGLWAARHIALDAIPDLSDVQVIIRANYPGQTAQQIENQVTFPLTSQLMAISEAKAVRGFSMPGDAYVYIIFTEGTDYDWARARVLEYLNQVAPKLPQGVNTMIGPEASGVSWVYQYALLDRSGKHDLSELRSLQDWFLKFELQGLPGVAEVASLGGMVKQYQVLIDPEKQRYFGIPLAAIEEAIRQGNQESSGSVIELGEAEYAVHANGYIQGIDDLENLPIHRLSDQGTPILLKDIATIQTGPQMRRGLADLNGEGEVVGGIVVMRADASPLDVIKRVQDKLSTLRPALPPGVEIVTTYDRSQLILRSVQTLINKLWQEALAIFLVCWLFLKHLRSAWVAIITLPVGILTAFIVMYYQGISANIMSLGGVAIAVGTMVDAAIVMIENQHKHLQAWRASHTAPPTPKQHWKIVETACSEVGPSLFYSLLIIALSFLPVLLLEAEEGRLFAPLAYTKTYAMAMAAALSITLVPVLAGYLIRHRLSESPPSTHASTFTKGYTQLLHQGLAHPWILTAACLALILSTAYPIMKTSNELMPELEEGDLLYMPTTLPGISIGKARELLTQTDRAIKSIPEVQQVFGKIGRADTATDPAPLSMIETTIQLKPKEQWRPGLTLSELIEELDQSVQIPGLSNAWVQPIKTRIDMLSTGVRTPLGIKITGTDQKKLEALGEQITRQLSTLAATRSVFSDRQSQGRYIEIFPDRITAARFGVSMADIHRTIRLAIGGAKISESLEGRERYPITLRYPRHERDSIEKLHNIPVISATGEQIPLARIARIEVMEGPSMIKTENARLGSWIMLDIGNADPVDYMRKANHLIQQKLIWPAGYTMSWTGKSEVLQRSAEYMPGMIILLLLITSLLLWMIFRSPPLLLLALLPLPLAMVGGFWYVWVAGFQFSTATTVGFLALAGIAVEFNVVMLLYLEIHRQQAGQINTQPLFQQIVMQGALSRLRPKAMTVMVILIGLLAIMIGSGSGLDLMQRVAAPMLGGMLTAPLLSMIVIPVAYYHSHKNRLRGVITQSADSVD